MTIISDLNALKNPKQAKLLQGFFKTGRGQYGEGDIFLGLTMPQQRKIAKKYRNVSLSEVTKVLKSKIHEHRSTALIILVEKFKKASEKEKSKIVKVYIKNRKYVNNWDLVDISAPKILGTYLFDKKTKILYTLAKSKSLWDRRIAMISTAYFISQNDFSDALQIAEILVNDKHDLIHKAVGWMLREIGKRDMDVEETFLKKHYRTMPRTMLRYAIEKFPKEKRKFYMKK